MTIKHLSEEEIQQWVLDKTKCSDAVISHMHDCEYCRTSAESYRVLFSEIAQQPRPVFDFNVPALVLPQIPGESSSYSRNYFPGYLIVFFLIAASCITGYFYRAAIGNLIKKYIFSISSGISRGTLYLLLTAAVVFLIFQSFELFKKYRQKVDDLNFY